MGPDRLPNSGEAGRVASTQALGTWKKELPLNIDTSSGDRRMGGPSNDMPAKTRPMTFRETFPVLDQCRAFQVKL